MKIVRIDGIYEITISKKEYYDICEKENMKLDFYHQYDLDEILSLETEEVIINETMLDKCECGFFMWRETFDKIIMDYPGIPEDIRTDVLNYDEIRIDFERCEAHHLLPYLYKMKKYGIDICENSQLSKDIDRLCEISEILYYEECDNFGISKEASNLRKEWRKICKIIKKTMKSYIKNHISYEKEWSRPRTEWIIPETGEIHNGFFYLIIYVIKGYINLIPHIVKNSKITFMTVKNYNKINSNKGGK
jgi:hypothetical protein